MLTLQQQQKRRTRDPSKTHSLTHSLALVCMCVLYSLFSSSISTQRSDDCFRWLKKRSRINPTLKKKKKFVFFYYFFSVPCPLINFDEWQQYCWQSNGVARCVQWDLGTPLPLSTFSGQCRAVHRSLWSYPVKRSSINATTTTAAAATTLNAINTLRGQTTASEKEGKK